MGKNKKKQPTRPSSLKRVKVDNPDWTADREGMPAFPRKIDATINIKESAVETLFSRGFLHTPQKKAADMFRAYYEAAGGKISSIDYTQDRVDGGRGDPVTAKLRAAHELKRCQEMLGRRHFENIEKLCGEGKALSELSPHKRDKTTMADNLRADLDDLATMWGLQTKRRSAA